jgi:hypothetical protein
MLCWAHCLIMFMNGMQKTAVPFIVVILYHLPNRPDRFWGPRTLLLLNTRGSFLGGKGAWTSSWKFSVILMAKLWMNGVVGLFCCLYMLVWNSHVLFLSLFLILIYCYAWSYSITQTRGRTHLDKGSARRRDLYLTTQHPYETDNYARGRVWNR